MKPHYILILLFLSLAFVSCEKLGIRVTSVKGVWESDTYGGKNKVRYTIGANDKYSMGVYFNDSLVYGRNGTWVLKNDTINFYYQNIGTEFSGNSRQVIEQLGMNTMTLRSVSHKTIMVYNRVSSTPESDEIGRFLAVLEYKGGFWWIFSWILIGITGFVLLGCGLEGIYRLLKTITRFCRDHILRK